MKFIKGLVILFLMLGIMNCNGKINKDVEISEDAVNKKDALATFEIKNSFEISIPDELELRDEESEIAKKMNEFRDKYNSDSVNEMNKSELVFQPKGSNSGEKVAISDVTRVIVDLKNDGVSTYFRYDFELSREEENYIYETIKQQAISTLETLPFIVKNIEWKPLEKGIINNQNYFKIIYTYEINNQKSYSETYNFFNKNEMVTISLETDVDKMDYWLNKFELTVNSFRFKSLK